MRHIHQVINLETFLAADLKVSQNISTVYLVGQRGANLSNFRIPTVVIQNLQPHIIVLDLGTNDLAPGLTAATVADGIMALAQHLLTCTSVVVLLSVVPRGTGFQSGVTQDTFLESMKQVNSLLKSYCSQGSQQGILFCRSKGFYEVEHEGKKVSRDVATWSYDGIHPNNRRGREIYKNGVRMALVLGWKYLHQQAKSVA
jgi:hypothetical protein